MTDLERILPLRRELDRAHKDYVLATVVAVDGSSYRRPGALMLMAEDGRRAGTVSGGCLEAEVARRAWWLSANGPVAERYSTVADDGDHPYGSGCGGVVHILLERQATAGPLLDALEAAFVARVPLAVATVLEGPWIAQRAFAGLPQSTCPEPTPDTDLDTLASHALAAQSPARQTVLHQGASVAAWADFRRARPGLWVFGAGDDARPLVRLARELGWFVAVADSRSHLATPERFPQAHAVLALTGDTLPSVVAGILPGDAVAAITHSYDQDLRLLVALLQRASLPAYVGVLGPRRRTRELLLEAAATLGEPDAAQCAEQWLAQLHAPIGLDLGAEAPASIALSILAEIQSALTDATALPMRAVRR